MNKPLIQIDDEVREMTDEEYAQYLEMQANAPKPLEEADDAPAPLSMRAVEPDTQVTTEEMPATNE